VSDLLMLNPVALPDGCGIPAEDWPQPPTERAAAVLHPPEAGREPRSPYEPGLLQFPSTAFDRCTRENGKGVEATKNIVERAHRCGVWWRKRSQGTRSEKDHCWVERVLSLRHTWRIRGRPTFPWLVEAASCLFQGERPELSWITQHESLLVSSTL